MLTDVDVDFAQKVMLEVKERLKQMALTRLHQAVPVQRRAAKIGGERTLTDGRREFAIHPSFFHYWGQRLRYECWDDPQFVHEFLRDNPECRVKSRTGRIQVGMRSDAVSNKRWSKNYGVWKSPK